jgi:hypothetical protein
MKENSFNIDTWPPPAAEAPPGTKTFAFGLRTNSFALGFSVDFFAEAVAGGVDEVVDATDADISCGGIGWADSVSDFCLCTAFGDAML